MATAQQTKQLPWWKRFPVTQPFGQHGEQGTDYGLPFHTAVTLPIGGRVSREGCYGYGCEVDVLTSLPGIGQVTEYVIHLDTIAAGIFQGAELPPGAFLGLSGGETTAQVAAGMFQGAQHPAGTQFSTGPHIEEGFVLGGATPFTKGAQYINPAPILDNLTGTGNGQPSCGDLPTAVANCAAQCKGATNASACMDECLQPYMNCSGSPSIGPNSLNSIGQGIAQGFSSAGNSLLHVFGFTSAKDAAYRVTLVLVGVIILLFALFKLFERDISAVV